MCFQIVKGNKRVKIAKKAITCYKVGYKSIIPFIHFKAFIQNWIYTIGAKQPIVVLHPIQDEVYKGYHSFSIVDKVLFKQYAIGRFIIPKEARYYYNPYNKEYVSNTIIFKGFVK
jgi:hypothetical protein